MQSVRVINVQYISSLDIRRFYLKFFLLNGLKKISYSVPKHSCFTLGDVFTNFQDNKIRCKNTLNMHLTGDNAKT